MAQWLPKGMTRKRFRELKVGIARTRKAKPKKKKVGAAIPRRISVSVKRIIVP